VSLDFSSRSHPKSCRRRSSFLRQPSSAGAPCGDLLLSETPPPLSLFRTTLTPPVFNLLFLLPKRAAVPLISESSSFFFPARLRCFLWTGLSRSGVVLSFCGSRAGGLFSSKASPLLSRFRKTPHPRSQARHSSFSRRSRRTAVASSPRFLSLDSAFLPTPLTAGTSSKYSLSLGFLAAAVEMLGRAKVCSVWRAVSPAL
jgi:hypothetical protein